VRFPNVLITGASDGIGRGLALHYARAGATVHALARRAARLEELSRHAIEAGAAGRIVPVPLDVADAESQAAAIEAAHLAAGGALDLVIANAGISEPTPAERMDWRVVKRVLEVNVTAACVTVAAALPAMVTHGRGTVVAVGSLAGYRGLPDFAAYCASKSAVRTFMESVRVDLRGSGVAAVSVFPGFVKTVMTAKARYPMPFLMELDDAVARIVRGIEGSRAIVAFPFPLAAMVHALRGLPRSLYELLASSRKR
jgi:short-subunit dehydrogenase